MSLATTTAYLPAALLPIGFALLGLVSCGDKSGDEEDGGAACSVPTADAGSDASVTLGNAVALDASASTWCADTASSLVFTWSFLQVPVESAVGESSLSDNRSNSAVSPIFTPDVLGDYTLSLVLTDSNGTSTEDIVVVTVQAGDQLPIADCGGQYTGEVGQISTLDASASYDPENADLTYEWSLTPPECSGLGEESLYNTGGAKPSFVPDCDGKYLVGLVVSDGTQWSEAVVCEVEVGSGNDAPIADAGDGGQLGPCAANPLQLDGNGSYDADGDALTYEWSVQSVPLGSASSNDSFSDRSSPTSTFAWDVDGEYELLLRVSDGTTWSPFDIVTYIVSDLEENILPVANAGADQTIEAFVDCESSSYVWTCGDCDATDLELDGSASFDENGDPLEYAWSEPTMSLQILSPNAPITEAIIPPQAAEYGTGNAIDFEVTLAVADCEEAVTDTTIIHYSCTGQKP